MRKQYRTRKTYGNIPRVTVQHAALLAVLAWDPLLAAARLLLLGHEPVNRPLLAVDDDLVAVLDERDRPTDERLGYDMA